MQPPLSTLGSEVAKHLLWSIPSSTLQGAPWRSGDSVQDSNSAGLRSPVPMAREHSRLPPCSYSLIHRVPQPLSLQLYFALVRTGRWRQLWLHLTSPTVARPPNAGVPGRLLGQSRAKWWLAVRYRGMPSRAGPNRHAPRSAMGESSVEAGCGRWAMGAYTQSADDQRPTTTVDLIIPSLRRLLHSSTLHKRPHDHGLRGMYLRPRRARGSR